MQPPRPLLTFAGYQVNGTPNGRPPFGQGAAISASIYDDWADASNVAGTLTTTVTLVSVVTGTVAYGNIQSGQTVSGATPFSVTIGSGAGYNHNIPFTLSLVANGGTYTATMPFTVTTMSSIQPAGGTITSNTVWTNDKTYLVTSNLGIAPRVTLVIQPGTTVKFNGNYSFSVGGTLVADGTTEQPIVFMPNSPGGVWDRIYFDDPSTDAVADASGEAYCSCSEPIYGVWQSGKKVLLTILEICPLVAWLLGRKYGRSAGGGMTLLLHRIVSLT